MNKLEFGAFQAVEKCMKVRPREKVVIIADRRTDKIARYIERAASRITPHVAYFIMEDFGKRPFKIPQEIFGALQKADVSFYCGDYAEGELKIFRQPIYDLIAKSKLRHASMPSLSKKIMEQGMNADYAQLKRFTQRVFEILSKSRNITVQTELGTDLRVKVGKYRWYKCDGDIQPGNFSNLPDGEVFTSPENVNGRVVIDGVLGDYFDKRYGCISKTPLSVDIKNCRAVRGTLKCKNKDIKRDLIAYIFRENSPNSTRVGEFALGTNLQLEKIIGNTLQDEKFPGVHIAFGDCYPQDTGCPFACDYHVDGVILKARVVADGIEIMEKGKYLI